MESLTQELRELFASFTQRVEAAVRKAALAAMSEALAGAEESESPRQPPRPRQVSRLQRRDASDIDAVKGRLLATIASRPGLRFEQLRAALKLERRELVLPLRKLMSERKVKMTGVKRAAAYFPEKRMTTRVRPPRKKRRR